MSDSTNNLLDYSLLHWLQVALAVSAAGWAVWEAVGGRFSNAAALAAVAGLGLVLIATPQRLAALFRLALLTAAYINGAGFVLNLWVQRTPFDEIVHALTSFSATATVAWLLLARTALVKRSEWLKLVAAALAIGAALGIAWEAFEWIIGIAGSRRDTIVDVLMDLIGALAAGLFCAVAAELRRAGSA